MDAAARGTATARLAGQAKSVRDFGKSDRHRQDRSGAPRRDADGGVGESKQYAFRYDANTLVGRDALIIGRRDRAGIKQRLAPYFESIDELPDFVFGRSGMNEIDVQIFYGHVLKKPLPSPYGESAN